MIPADSRGHFFLGCCNTLSSLSKGTLDSRVCLGVPIDKLRWVRYLFLCLVVLPTHETVSSGSIEYRLCPEFGSRVLRISITTRTTSSKSCRVPKSEFRPTEIVETTVRKIIKATFDTRIGPGRVDVLETSLLSWSCNCTVTRRCLGARFSRDPCPATPAHRPGNRVFPCTVEQ